MPKSKKQKIYVVEKILDNREIDGKEQFYLKWKNYPE